MEDTKVEDITDKKQVMAIIKAATKDASFTTFTTFAVTTTFTNSIFLVAPEFYPLNIFPL